MRNLKRALSLALASVMLLGMMVVGTSAASYPDVVPENNTEAIAVLNAVGAMIGDENGNFNPDTPVTRNQMAAVVARLLLGPDAEDYAGTVPFTDVPEWAVKYVAACYDNGIVTGRDETTYDGDGTVTAQEAGVMMLRALGYENITDTGADWAKRAVAKAGEISLFKGVTGNVTATLTRNDIAQLSLNTLKSTCVKADVERDIVVEGVVTIPGKTTYTVVESDDEYATAINDTEKGPNGNKTVQLGEKLYDGKLVLTPADITDETAPTDDLGRPASTWTYDGGDPVFTVAEKADYTVTLAKAPKDEKALLDLAKKNLKGVTEEGDGDGEATSAITYTLNGDEKSDFDVTTLGAGDVVEMYLVSTGDDKGKVDNIFITRYVLDKITGVDDDVKDDDAEEGVSCYVDFDGKGGTKVNNTDIPGFNADTYVEDAYVALLISKEGTTDEKIVDSYIVEIVEDSIDTVKTKTVDDENVPDEITIGKDKYTVAAGYASEETVAPGDDNTYALYLDKNGYVLGIEKVEGEAAGIDDVYYLDSVWKETGKMNSVNYYAQLVALDGTKKEVELEKVGHDFGDGHEADLAAYAVPSDAAPADDGEGGGDDGGDEDADAAEEFTVLTNMLVTISDKDGTEEGDTSKKNNSKYNVTVWESNSDWAGSKLADVSEFALKKADRKLGTYRLNGSTVYLFAEGTGKDLALTRYEGGITYTPGDDGVDAVFVITEKNKDLAKYVVIATASADLDAEYTGELIFINKASTAKGKDYRSQEVYLPDGTKETWKIEEKAYTDGNLTAGIGFYQYSEGDNGIYEVKKATEMTVSEDLEWQKDKKEGVLSEVTFSGSNALFEGTLTVTTEGGKVVNDIDVSGADFTDLHNTDEGYNKTVKSLQALADLMEGKSPKAGEATLYMNVSKDGAVSIFVTAVSGPKEFAAEIGTVMYGADASEATAEGAVAAAGAEGTPAEVKAFVTITLKDASIAGTDIGDEAETNLLVAEEVVADEGGGGLLDIDALFAAGEGEDASNTITLTISLKDDADVGTEDVNCTVKVQVKANNTDDYKDTTEVRLTVKVAGVEEEVSD